MLTDIKNLSMSVRLKSLGLLGLLFATLVSSSPHHHQQHDNDNHLVKRYSTEILQPVLSSSSYVNEQPWIGSHTLKFTPNPFLNSVPVPAQFRQLELTHPSDFIQQSLISTAESPLPPSTSTETPLDISLNDVTQPIIMGKRGRKIRRKMKGRRRRLSPHKKNASRRYQRKKNKFDGENNKRRFITRRPKKILMKHFYHPYPTHVSDSKKYQDQEEGETKTVFNQSDFGNINFLSINKAINLEKPQVPPKTNSTTELDLITIPIVMDHPKTNLSIPMDIIEHPEKFNASFFRDIIVKTMMEKLTNSEISTTTTRAPILVDKMDADKKETTDKTVTV